MSDKRDSAMMMHAVSRGRACNMPKPRSNWHCMPRRKIAGQQQPSSLFVQVDGRTFGSELDQACVNFKNSPLCLSPVDVARARARKQQLMADMS